MTNPITWLLQRFQARQHVSEHDGAEKLSSYLSELSQDLDQQYYGELDGSVLAEHVEHLDHYLGHKDELTPFGDVLLSDLKRIRKELHAALTAYQQSKDKEEEIRELVRDVQLRAQQLGVSYHNAAS